MKQKYEISWDSIFNKSTIEAIVIKIGFKRRKQKKVSACNFLLSFFLMAIKGSNSYSTWSEQLCLLTGRLVSKQAIFARMGKSALEMVRSLLQERLKQEPSLRTE